MKKSDTKKNKNEYSKKQRITLIACVAIMVLYVIIAYIIAEGSFWDFAAFHAVLAAVTILSLWLGGVFKVVTYMVILLSVVGAGTALALMLYYLWIMISLATA